MATDISKAPVIRPQGAQNMTLNLLPTRGEKRLIPSPITVTQASQVISQGFAANPQTGASTPTQIEYPLSVSDLQEDFNLAAALEPLTDFVTITMQNRGINAQGGPDQSSNAVFRFLINPSQVSISHSTLEGESFARSGWLYGVWGEDMVRISLTGKTPGNYFAMGLTDEFAEYAESYRNLEQLQDVFENNGYWFEGESVDYGTSLTNGGWSGTGVGFAANFGRRPIKMHQDVILSVKEFIWYGMFESFEWSQDADSPYLATWALTFLAWKEHFRGDSPYNNPIQNDVQRGNAYSVYSQVTKQNPVLMPLPLNTNQIPANLNPGPQAPGNTTATSPAALAEALSLPTIEPTALDYSITPNVVMNANGSQMNDLLGIVG